MINILNMLIMIISLLPTPDDRCTNPTLADVLKGDLPTLTSCADLINLRNSLPTNTDTYLELPPRNE